MTYTIVVVNANNTEDTYTTRSINKAYQTYDRAIAKGLIVKSFTGSVKKDGYTSDMLQGMQPQAAIVWNKQEGAN